MRIRWRGLELPGRVVRDEAVSTDSYGRFVIEPFEQGFGTTIGNSLRRVLLSSLEGAAVATVKIEGVAHEFSSIDGVLEDVTDIILNVKSIILAVDGAGSKTMTVARDTVGVVTAGDIMADASVDIANPDQVIATLTADVPFRAEFKVLKGRGFVRAAENRTPEQEIGVIPIDSVYSPVIRVRYRTEDMRVGQVTNFDRLILEIWTNGVVKPEDALSEAALILRKHLNPLVMCGEVGEEMAACVKPAVLDEPSPELHAREELLAKSVAVLNLSVRARNCLDAARVTTIRELVSRNPGDLLRVRSFGNTSLTEVQMKLADLGLQLGMDIDDAAQAEASETPMGAPVAPPLAGPIVGASPLSQTEVPGGSEGAGLGEVHSNETGPKGPDTGPMAAFTMGD